jgi:hypothetical protein
MQEISIKKILIFLAIIITLSQLHKILAFMRAVHQFVWDGLEPARHFSTGEKYLVILGLLALVYITIFRLLLNRK